MDWMKLTLTSFHIQASQCPGRAASLLEKKEKVGIQRVAGQSKVVGPQQKMPTRTAWACSPAFLQSQRKTGLLAATGQTALSQEWCHCHCPQHQPTPSKHLLGSGAERLSIICVGVSTYPLAHHHWHTIGLVTFQGGLLPGPDVQKCPRQCHRLWRTQEEGTILLALV